METEEIGCPRCGGERGVRFSTSNPCRCEYAQIRKYPLLVSIEEIIGMQQRRVMIVQADLDDIIFTLQGMPLDIDKEVKDEFNMSGLTNIDFITSKYYLRTKDE